MADLRDCPGFQPIRSSRALGPAATLSIVRRIRVSGLALDPKELTCSFTGSASLCGQLASITEHALGACSLEQYDVSY